MLTVNNVVKKYKNFTANNNLSFEIGNGEIGVLLGPNGAGKSTIIKSIVGLLRFQGSIQVDGFDCKSIEAKRKLGYVPEIPALYDALTVEEHIEFIRRAYKFEDKSVGERYLERFELGDKRRKLGKELSKGMQQKVSICCALAHDPDVIIFDEPMVGLDPHAIKELKEVFKELRDAGKTVLVSTHMIDTIEDTWDVIHIMKAGQIAATKHKEDVDGNESIEKLFFEITEGRD